MMSFQFTQPKRAATSKGKDAGIDPAFQFTQPKRAATNSTLGSFDLIAVSIHAAQAGCDRLRVHHCLYNQSVSIHAAQAGCDWLYGLESIMKTGFNSRSPSGLRRCCWCRRTRRRGVSIHAAQAGCDFSFGCPISAPSGFQFTQPKRAATSQTVWRVCRPRCFNSRSPSGLRPAIYLRIVTLV